MLLLQLVGTLLGQRLPGVELTLVLLFALPLLRDQALLLLLRKTGLAQVLLTQLELFTLRTCALVGKARLGLLACLALLGFARLGRGTCTGGLLRIARGVGAMGGRRTLRGHGLRALRGSTLGGGDLLLALARAVALRGFAGLLLGVRLLLLARLLGVLLLGMLLLSALLLGVLLLGLGCSLSLGCLLPVRLGAAGAVRSFLAPLGRGVVLRFLLGGICVCGMLRRPCERLRAGAQRKSCSECQGDRGAGGVEEIHGDLVYGQAIPALAPLHGCAT
jgi:hypothetical protein